MAPHLAEVLDLVDHLAQALGAEHDGDRIGLAARVQRDDAPAEPFHRDPVLLLEEEEPLRLLLELRRQPVELRLVEREHGLERRELRLRRVDVALEDPDLARDRRNLGGQDLLPGLRALDPRLQLADLRVHRLLAGADAAASGRPGRNQAQNEQETEGYPSSHGGLFVGSATLPPRTRMQEFAESSGVSGRILAQRPCGSVAPAGSEA